MTGKPVANKKLKCMVACLQKITKWLGSRFGACNIDGFNMMSLMLPGVAVTYNGEEIGMTNTNVSWEDTVDPAGLNCGEEHFNVSTACIRVT